MYHRSVTARLTRLRRPPSSLLTMAPSSIHHIDSAAVDVLSPDLDRGIIELSKSALRAGDLLKVQAVQNDEGLWFALNSAQLDLCRRLEDEGACKVVLVDPVPAAEVPRDVRRMMKLPVAAVVAGTGSGDPKTGSKEPEVDNNFAADVPEAQVGRTKGGGGKGYRMLDQADPMDATSLRSTEGGGRGSHASPTDDDVTTRARGLNDLEADDKVVDTDDEEDEDGSSSDSSSDSECDWSEEADDAGSEDDQARMADTSDEMSCLL